MRYAPFLGILTLLSLSTMNLANAARANALWSTGVYKLLNSKGRTGMLTVHASSPAQATFSMNVVVCMNYCGTDTAVNHIGEVINGSISISGKSGRFVELAPATEPPIQERVTCELAFSRRQSNLLVVAQKMECWQFGQGVDVSGTYRLVTGKADAKNPVSQY